MNELINYLQLHETVQFWAPIGLVWTERVFQFSSKQSPAQGNICDRVNVIFLLIS